MSLRDDLYEWLGSLPAWQQDLAGRLTKTTHLEADDLDEARRGALAAHGALADGEEAPDAAALTLDDLPGLNGPNEDIRLLRIANLRNVGLVADDQEIRFGPDGLTIIYGPNAAGKSTYVRALKRVCRTVDCDSSIRSNVFDPNAQHRPAATIEYTRSGEQRAQVIDLNLPAHTGLDALSVFDARCAELYLDSSNAVAYVPSSLAVLARMAATQDELRRWIDGEIATLERTRPTFADLDAGTAARELAESVTADTSVDEVRSFTELNEAEQLRITELRAALAVAASRNARADADASREEARRATDAIDNLQRLARYVTDDECARINANAADLSGARAAVAAAAEEFSSVGRPGVGGDAWRHMWEAARQFVEANNGRFPPAEGETCPFCIQPIDSDTAARVRHFEQHIQSTLQTRATDAERRLAASLQQVDPSQLQQVGQTFTEAVAELEPELAGQMALFRQALRQRLQTIHSDPLATTLARLPPIPALAVTEWARQREEHAAMLLSAADPEGERSLRRELAELTGREMLGRRLDTLGVWVGTLRRVRALRRAHTALATNRITSKQRELSTLLVTDALASALIDELKRLNCQHLPIDLEPHTAIGATQVVLRLAGAHGAPAVSEILSEGEQRALSLAFFFAETHLAEDKGGVIVDDPVSSLDDERRSYIARRLARETKNRQVIVFTHDLPFMLDLVEQAEKLDLEPKLQGIWRLGTSVGRVDQRPPFAALKFKERVGDLEQRVARWDNQTDPRDADEAWQRVCDLYADMRTTWERAVEERLFQGVVQRFQREVKTLKLPSVKVTDELVSAIEEGMTRCSYFVHDAPTGTRTTLPGRVELAGDVEKLRGFERATRPR